MSNVDRDKATIKNIVILQEGMDKAGDYFDIAFLNDLAQQGNDQTSGVKARFGHPELLGTALGTFIGRYKNFRVVTGAYKDKVIADLYLDPITEKLQVDGKGISIKEYILHMAEHNPDMFGNSINFTHSAYKQIKELNGIKKEVTVYKLKEFIASDLVDSPCATDSLFKSRTIYPAAGQSRNSINHLKSKNMSFIKTIKKKLGMTKDIDLTLAQGSILTIITENENYALGDRVQDSEGGTPPDGDYLLADGVTVLSVVDGAISDISTIATESDQAIELVAEELKEMKKNYREVSEAIELLVSEMATYKERQKVIGKSMRVASPTFKPEPVGSIKKEFSGFNLNKLRAERTRLTQNKK